MIQQPLLDFFFYGGDVYGVGDGFAVAQREECAGSVLDDSGMFHLVAEFANTLLGGVVEATQPQRKGGEVELCLRLDPSGGSWLVAVGWLNGASLLKSDGAEPRAVGHVVAVGADGLMSGVNASTGAANSHTRYCFSGAWDSSSWHNFQSLSFGVIISAVEFSLLSRRRFDVYASSGFFILSFGQARDLPLRVWIGQPQGLPLRVSISDCYGVSICASWQFLFGQLFAGDIHGWRRHARQGRRSVRVACGFLGGQAG